MSWRSASYITRGEAVEMILIAVTRGTNDDLEDIVNRLYPERVVNYYSYHEQARVQKLKEGSNG